VCENTNATVCRAKNYSVNSPLTKSAWLDSVGPG
jgi:hypothetical protein